VRKVYGRGPNLAVTRSLQKNDEVRRADALSCHVAIGVMTDDAADPLDNAGGRSQRNGALDVRSGATVNRGGLLAA
jgi:hypothetical protein